MRHAQQQTAGLSRTMLALAATAMLITFTGCPDDEAEELGEKVDDVAEDVKDEAEDVVDSAEDVVDAQDPNK